MVYKVNFFLLLLLYINTAYSNIIFDKNNISITDIEYNSYKEIYQQNYGTELSKNQAIKDIFLMKKTLNFLLADNPEFVYTLDEKIEFEFGKKVFENNILINFLRLEKIKTEFVLDYFKNNFELNDLKSIFSELDNLNLPISQNNCLTIVKIHQLKEDSVFILSFFENIKIGKKNIKTKIDNEFYDVCINNKQFRNLEKIIFKYIENKTSKNFEEFIYSKLN